MPYFLRKATSQDMGTLQRLDRECYVYEWDDKVWKGAVQDAEVKILIAGTQAIGFWVGKKSPDNGDIYNIYKMGIARQYRRKRQSWALMIDCLEHASSRSFITLSMMVSEENCGVYDEINLIPWLERMDFVATGYVDKGAFFSHGSTYDGYEFERLVECSLRYQ